jgi:hypothetical protein
MVVDVAVEVAVAGLQAKCRLGKRFKSFDQMRQYISLIRGYI